MRGELLWSRDEGSPLKPPHKHTRRHSKERKSFRARVRNWQQRIQLHRVESTRVWYRQRGTDESTGARRSCPSGLRHAARWRCNRMQRHQRRTASIGCRSCNKCASWLRRTAAEKQLIESNLLGFTAICGTIITSETNYKRVLALTWSLSWDLMRNIRTSSLLIAHKVTSSAIHSQGHSKIGLFGH